MTLDEKIAAAKREVRATYDGPVAKYEAAERKLAALLAEKDKVK